jgi:hypothetical protein
MIYLRIICWRSCISLDSFILFIILMYFYTWHKIRKNISNMMNIQCHLEFGQQQLKIKIHEWDVRWNHRSLEECYKQFRTSSYHHIKYGYYARDVLYFIKEVQSLSDPVPWPLVFIVPLALVLYQIDTEKFQLEISICFSFLFPIYIFLEWLSWNKIIKFKNNSNNLFYF